MSGPAVVTPLGQGWRNSDGSIGFLPTTDHMEEQEGHKVIQINVRKKTFHWKRLCPVGPATTTKYPVSPFTSIFKKLFLICYLRKQTLHDRESPDCIDVGLAIRGVTHRVTV